MQEFTSQVMSEDEDDFKNPEKEQQLPQSFLSKTKSPLLGILSSILELWDLLKSRRQSSQI